MTFWIHEISQSALAAAVATMGVVILLELRSISRLRHAVDNHLARLFEQLDLLRFESQQLLEVQTRAPAHGEQVPAQKAPPAAAAAAHSLPLAGGEARLLAAMTAARARLARSASQCDSTSTH